MGDRKRAKTASKEDRDFLRQTLTSEITSKMLTESSEKLKLEIQNLQTAEFLRQTLMTLKKTSEMLTESSEKFKLEIQNLETAEIKDLQGEIARINSRMESQV